MIETIKLSKNVDERGNLLANTREDIMHEVKHFFVSRSVPGAVRGNHYHKHKTEWFLIIQGTCEIKVKDMETEEEERLTISDNDSVLVSMVPGKAHAMKNIGDNELILLALVNEVLDKEDPDTYPYKVI